MKKELLAAAVLAAAASTHAVAAPATQDYGYFQLNYAKATVEIDGVDDVDANGIGLAGNIALGDNAFITLGLQNLGGDVFGYDIDTRETWIGFGGAWGVSESTDFLAQIRHIRADLEIESFGDTDDTAKGIDLGFRGMPGSNVELFGLLNYVDYDGGSETGFTFGGRVEFNDMVSGVLSWQTADDVDTIMLGLRFGG